MNIVMLGPPGSGKGTQSKKISLLNDDFVVIDCGKLLRNIELQDDVKNKMEQGNLLDDTLVISVVKKKIYSVISEGKCFILDGFPRTVKQCEALFEILDELEIGISCMVKLEIDDQILIERLSKRVICKKCGEVFNIQKGVCDYCSSTEYIKRGDDFDSKFVEKRLSTYRFIEKSIVQFFKGTKTKILSINANKNVEAVTADIRAQLLMFS
jgi:adenylate kinase